MDFKTITDTKNVTVDVNGLVEPIIDIPDNWYRLDNAKILAKVLTCLIPNTSKHFAGFLTYAYYNLLPDYFFTTPSSSTGKYHPAFANAKNGLVLHSLAVVLYTTQLFEILEFNRSIASSCAYNDIYNNIIVAAFLHDMFKYGDPATYTTETYTCHEHPALAAAFFRSDEIKPIAAMYNLTSEDLEFIASLIESHMGPWTTSKYSNVVLPAPKTSFEMLLHKADYFASMKEGAILPPNLR